MNMYRNICNPVINRSLWSASEDVKLKELIQKHGHQSWSQVADELGVSFFKCELRSIHCSIHCGIHCSIHSSIRCSMHCSVHRSIHCNVHCNKPCSIPCNMQSNIYYMPSRQNSCLYVLLKYQCVCFTDRLIEPPSFVCKDISRHSMIMRQHLGRKKGKKLSVNT